MNPTASDRSPLPEPHPGEESTVHPRFSVLIPAYNRAHLLRHTIESVLTQTFSSFEVIVIDDGSTDNTLALLNSYGDRIKVLRQQNAGPEEARRKAGRVATGEYFVLLDSDDLLLPWALATYDRIIREFDAPGLIIGSLLHFMNGESPAAEYGACNEIAVIHCADYLAKNVPVGLSSSNIVVRRTVFERSGALHTATKTFPMDTFHYVLLFGTFGPCVIVQAPHTVGYRQHEGNAVHDTVGMVKALLLLVAAEYQGRYPGGDRRRFDRYVCIGGITVCWVAKAFRRRLVRLAVSTMIRTSPMLLAGVLRKVARGFRPRPSPLRLATGGR